MKDRKFFHKSKSFIFQVVATGRASQNYYHYYVMTRLPHFLELSPRYDLRLLYGFLKP